MEQSIIGPILITGSSGFIGSVLARTLVEQGADVHLILRSNASTWRIDDLLPRVKVHHVNLTDRDGIFACVREVKPGVIFHLAAYGAYPFQKEVNLIEATNVHGTMNLLDACVESGFEAFINTGSSSEYGFKQEPMKETDVLHPNSHYAIFKATATHYCEYVASSNKLPIVTLRPFSVYGPYEEPSRLVPTLLMKLMKGECPPLASPDIARDYIYVDDMVEAFLSVAKRPDLMGETFNVGSGKQTTLKEIVDLSIRLVGTDVVPSWGTMEQRIWDQNTWQSDISKIQSMLHWSPQMSLEQGLSKMIEWLKIHQTVYEKCKR